MKESCEYHKDLIPLHFINRLSRDEEIDFKEHLKLCNNCRQVFRSETALMLVAAGDREFGVLGEHPENHQLVEAAGNSSGSGIPQARQVATHLEQCQICREIVANLKSLPQSIDDLVDQGTPSWDSLAKHSIESGQNNLIDLTRKIFWHPLTAYAAAAVVIIVAILRPPSVERVPTAVMEIRIPAGERGVDSVPSYSSPTPNCFAKLSYFLSPTDGHHYNASVKRADSDETMWSEDNFGDFDPRGLIQITLPLDTGEYYLEIADLAPSDTVKVRRGFRIVYDAQ